MPDETSRTESGREDSKSAKEPLRELTFGQVHIFLRAPELPREPNAQADVGTSDLEFIAAFCRAKADAARWAAERQRRIRERCEFPGG